MQAKKQKRNTGDPKKKPDDGELQDQDLESVAGGWGLPVSSIKEKAPTPLRSDSPTPSLSDSSTGDLEDCYFLSQLADATKDPSDL